MKTWMIVSVIACFIIGLTAGCSDQSAFSSGNAEGGNIQTPLKRAAIEDKYVTIVTGGTSGVYFQLGNALAKEYGEKLGARASAQTTGASVENIEKIHRKQAELGFAMADIVGDAYEGKGTFSNVGPLQNLASIASLYPNYMQIVTTKKSGIKTLQDIKGKRVAVGAIGSGTEIMTRQILEGVGLTYNDVKADFLSFAEGVEGIKHATIDVAFLSSGYPNAGIMDLAETHDIYLIPIPNELTEKLKKQHPSYSYSTIPANTYKGVTKAVATITANNILITHKDMTDDEVYELTKTLFENIDTLHSTHSSAQQIKLETAAYGLPIPLHPGAARYYTEKNVWP
ncbi:TAXI family TRAP transporter solute-binding subunit [Aneurinibacillus uraniidurans]|uniref:TAXI family TRAP transporter solute-binding subunit n=1 Tax=Aneurinibacillus uraniidurans TaxID=2966586 RepID=UPI00234A101A|nr:TAXI family TRAP transporter solute-binding subunit [Aneurinibacillus sp. B1]WCN38903.1 TAXI family TRAP transporter solute-binding subunit [Aneurinibacillus sp. B1]